MKYAHTTQTPRRRPSVKMLTAAAVALITTGSMMLVLEHSASATTTATLSGNAVIANGSTDAEQDAGGSADLFTVNLPSGAACPADSSTGGFYVYSYLVKKGTDFSTLTFVNHPSVGLGLFTNTNAYFRANTAVGSPALINQIPSTLQFAALLKNSTLATLLYSGSTGVWEAGIACADSNNGGALSNYWNTEVTFTASSSDANGFTWAQVVGSTTTTDPSTTTTTTAGGTTTTTAGGTTTTTSGTSSTSTSTTLAGAASAASASSGGSGTGSSVSGSTFGSGGSLTSGGTTGTLPFTGLPVGKSLGLGLLLIGVGLILMAWGPRARVRYATVGRGIHR
jgi:hypothetical protein